MTKKKGVRTRAEAKKLMWEYYRDNKASLPKWIGEFREEVLNHLVDGKDVGAAFSHFEECVLLNTQISKAS